MSHPDADAFSAELVYAEFGGGFGEAYRVSIVNNSQMPAYNVEVTLQAVVGDRRPEVARKVEVEEVARRSTVAAPVDAHIVRQLQSLTGKNRLDTGNVKVAIRFTDSAGMRWYHYGRKTLRLIIP